MTIHLFGNEIRIHRGVLVFVLAVLILAGGMAGYLVSKSGGEIIVEHAEKGSAPAVTEQVDAEASSATEPPREEIKVYVTGCVKNPGIVTLQKGQLIDDAIRLAGGVTAQADLNSINLVYQLNENVMLRIISREEIKKAAGGGQTAGNNGTGGKSSVGGKASTSGNSTAGAGVKLVADSGGAVVSGDASSSGGSGKVNINTASAAELDTLPGVGEATARDIIEYREKNGPFKKIEDIMKVPRIKESRFNSIKGLITV